MGTVLIADGGSTKIHWARVERESGEVQELVTSGVNPAVMGSGRIAELFARELAGKFRPGITRVEFYGAGCKGVDARSEERRVG